MHIYLAIKYYPDAKNRPLIEALCAALTTAGHQVTCVARDLEEWGAVHFSPETLMQHSFRAIDAADLMLIEFSEKGVGLGIEAGYAHAQGIPVIVMARRDAEISTTMAGIATQVLFYDMPAELASLALTVTPPHKATTAWPYAVRSVDRLLACLDDLSPDALNWQPIGTANSLLVLATHMIGNIEETIWGIVCGQPVQRDRDAEFRAYDSSSAMVRDRWQQMHTKIGSKLAMMNAADFAKPRYHPRRGPLSSNEILIIVARHAAEHLAQAEMTRELWLDQA